MSVVAAHGLLGARGPTNARCIPGGVASAQVEPCPSDEGLPLRGVQPGAVDLGAFAIRRLFFDAGLPDLCFAFFAFLIMGLLTASGTEIRQRLAPRRTRLLSDLHRHPPRRL